MQRLHLRNCLVIDGTGAPAYAADIITYRDRIVSVGPDMTQGGDLVECGGMVVCPGFIDTHSRSDLQILADPDLPMKVRQGVTLEVLGQDGLSVAPVRAADVERTRRKLAGLLGDPFLVRDWRSVADYLGTIDRSGAAVNSAYLVPHGAIRTYVMGDLDRAPTEDELHLMVALLGSGMADGALGMSTGLGYPPCCYAATEELVALGREVARKGGVFAVHLRWESDRILEALDEMIGVARETGVHLHLSHLTIAGRRNWPLVEQVVARVETAREDRLRVTADQYPYAAGSTLFGAILPPWAHAGGTEETLARLASPEERAKLRAAMQHDGPGAWDNFWSWTGPGGIVIADVPSGRRPELLGKTVAAAAAAAGAPDPLEFALDLLASERMAVAMISFSQSEEVVARLMTLPWVNGCSDGLLGGRPHPRAYGTFPRLLGRYVREQQVLSLPQMIRKVTSLAAAAMHLPDRGAIDEGLIADLVVFDPATVADTATFEDPVRYPIGIQHVIVNGALVVADGRPTRARPGRTVRLGQ
ncbi:MAG: D-aminoacylase [Myxococcales bacterium]|nr:D-aminoacylase [Myxococcales bacterium]